MFSISKCPQEEGRKLSADWNKLSFKDIILAKFLGNVGTSIFYDKMKVLGRTVPKIDQLWALPPTLQESEVFSPSLPGIQMTAPFSGSIL